MGFHDMSGQLTTVVNDSSSSGALGGALSSDARTVAPFGSNLALLSCSLFPQHVEFVHVLDNHHPFVTRVLYDGISLVDMNKKFGEKTVRRLFSLVAILAGLPFCATLPDTYDVSPVASEFSPEFMQSMGELFSVMYLQHCKKNGIKDWSHGPKFTSSEQNPFASEDQLKAERGHEADHRLATEQDDDTLSSVIADDSKVFLNFGDVISAATEAAMMQKWSESERKNTEPAPSSIFTKDFVTAISDFTLCEKLLKKYNPELNMEYAFEGHLMLLLRVAFALPVILHTSGGPAEVIVGQPGSKCDFIDHEEDVLAHFASVLESHFVIGDLKFRFNNTLADLVIADQSCLEKLKSSNENKVAGLTEKIVESVDFGF
eukprot:TRINITY_DN15520_c0_g1_i1.p1 TRINITY_DN15520_c0_g1~~TRINITY_DN15520_c0_g1_i1.p1  ORF type:complete len:387 (+),score=140.26 TRINITY_DN15520_c0_g1_i1:40-1161(+)